MEKSPKTNNQNVSAVTATQIVQKPEIIKGDIRKSQHYLIVFMAVVTTLSLFSAIYFAYRTQNLTNELSFMKNGQAASQKTMNENGDQSDVSPLVWSKLDLSETNNYFSIDVSSFMTKPAEDLNCLNNEDKEYPSMNLSNISSVPDDPNLSKFSKEIENHQFSDEQIIISESGQKSMLNTGKKSSRNITYKSVCKSNDTYFFIINTSISETGLIENLRNKLGLRGFWVKAAGGMSYPSHFIYSNEDGQLTYIENFPPSNSHLSLPPLKTNEDRVEEYSGLTTTEGIAYYGCSRIYTSNGSEALVGCGGGDGSAGGSGIFLVNLVSHNTKEKAFCLSNSKYSKRCFDDTGKVYKEELNQQ